MDTFFVAPAFLRLLAQGRLFRTLFTWLLRLQAALVVLLGVLASIELWRGTSGLSTSGVLGLLVFQLALAGALYFAAHLSWIRAGDVARMPDGQTSVIPLATLLVRLWGEIYGTVLAALSVGGAVLLWLAGTGAGRGFLGALQLGSFDVAGEAFPAGLRLLGVGLALAAFGLLGAYLLAELIQLLVSIEANTRRSN